MSILFLQPHSSTRFLPPPCDAFALCLAISRSTLRSLSILLACSALFLLHKFQFQFIVSAIFALDRCRNSCSSFAQRTRARDKDREPGVSEKSAAVGSWHHCISVRRLGMRLYPHENADAHAHYSATSARKKRTVMKWC